uniref:Uncharacterized protein n=1 Tax=Onchocerca volvulus TaxID=6282 RepID=A0A8R1TMA7_ONCVO
MYKILSVPGEQCKYRFLGCVVHQVYAERSNTSASMLIGNVIRMFVNHANVVNILDDPDVTTYKNIFMQHGLQKKLISTETSFLSYFYDMIKKIFKNDFILEYCGKVINHDESERRDKIYDKLKCNYLFVRASF